MGQQNEMSDQEMAGLIKMNADSKATLHSFFKDIIKADRTTKTGNLDKEELGNPKIPVRTLEELSVFCKDVANNDQWAEYFDKISEVQTSTSLSKEAKLLNLSVTMKKELADTSPTERKQNRGWFKKGNNQNQSPQAGGY